MTCVSVCSLLPFCLFNTLFGGSCCAPGITVSARGTVLNKTVPGPIEFYSLMREIEELTGTNDPG